MMIPSAGLCPRRDTSSINAHCTKSLTMTLAKLVNRMFGMVTASVWISCEGAQAAWHPSQCRRNSCSWLHRVTMALDAGQGVIPCSLEFKAYLSHFSNTSRADACYKSIGLAC